MTRGEWLFYGGIAGMVFSFAAAVIVTAVLAGQKKRLRKKLEAEYGESASR